MTENDIPLPDPIDVQQAQEEDVVTYALLLNKSKTELLQKQKELIKRAFDAKRDFEVNRAQLKYVQETLSLCQSVLRSLRPSF
jgi:hypothetical protein